MTKKMNKKMKKFAVFAKTAGLLLLTTQMHAMKMETVEWTISEKNRNEAEYVTPVTQTTNFDRVILLSKIAPEKKRVFVSVLLQNDKKTVNEICLNTPIPTQKTNEKKMDFILKVIEEGNKLTYKAIDKATKNIRVGSYDLKTHIFSIKDVMELESTGDSEEYVRIYINNVIHVGGKVVENKETNEK